MDEEPKTPPMQLVSELFARQHGVATDAQIHALGISAERRRTLIRNHVWTRLARSIVANAATADSWHRRAMAAALSAPGALMYGPSAARLHALDGYDRHDTVEVIVHRRAHVVRVAKVEYHYSRHLSAADRHVVESIPVTILPLTLIHLDADGHDAGKALDSALRLGFSPRWFDEQFRRWQRPNLTSPTQLLQLLEERVSARLPLSWFQRITKRVFDEVGITLVDEWPVHDRNGKTFAHLDLAEVDLMVGVECQSWEHHGSPSAQQRDLSRKRRLRQLGWDIVEVWWSDLERVDEVVADVRLALERARQRLGR